MHLVADQGSNYKRSHVNLKKKVTHISISIQTDTILEYINPLMRFKLIGKQQHPTFHKAVHCWLWQKKSWSKIYN